MQPETCLIRASKSHVEALKQQRLQGVADVCFNGGADGDSHPCFCPEICAPQRAIQKRPAKAKPGPKAKQKPGQAGSEPGEQEVVKPHFVHFQQQIVLALAMPPVTVGTGGMKVIAATRAVSRKWALSSFPSVQGQHFRGFRAASREREQTGCRNRGRHSKQYGRGCCSLLKLQAYRSTTGRVTPRPRPLRPCPAHWGPCLDGKRHQAPGLPRSGLRALPSKLWFDGDSGPKEDPEIVFLGRDNLDGAVLSREQERQGHSLQAIATEASFLGTLNIV